MTGFYTIGSLAREAGVTTRTVRYYEQRGLLPTAERDENGYRRYTRDTLNRLLFVLRAKSLGLALSEIQGFLEVAEGGQCKKTRSTLGALLDARITEFSRQIEDLADRRARLVDARRQLNAALYPVEEECGCPGCSDFDPRCECIPSLDNVAT
jgi:MerR family transcriptional regulator, copper efflux regulator